MMATIRKIWDSRAFLIGSSVWFVMASCFFVASHLVPTSYWLKVDQIKAGPAQAGQSVPMAVDREIVRPFFAEWTVNIKRFGVAGWVSYCSAYGESKYVTGAELPQKLDLDWWTEGRCKILPEGRYIVETTWRIQPTFSFLSVKVVSSTSNIFEVKP